MRELILQNARRIFVLVVGVAGAGLGLAGAWAQGLPGLDSQIPGPHTGSAQAQDAAAVPIHTTVVVYADRPLEDGAWAGLFDAVRTAVAGEKMEGLDEDAEFVRGDSIRPGIVVGDSIAVYLHGDCRLEPLPRRTAYSVPLGWVRRENGRIAPFIHVDCSSIGQVIGPRAQGLNEGRRNRMMARAVARVMVHEWIHVARQSAGHGREGITKAQFGPEDLVGEVGVAGRQGGRGCGMR